MPRNKATVACDITDTVNLQYRSEGYEIHHVRAAIGHIGCETAEGKFCLVYGEYTLFLLLRSTSKKHEYGIKAIRSPFIRAIPLDGNLSVFSNSSRLQVSLIGSPECTLEDMETHPGGKNMSCRITLSYRLEFRDSAEGEEKPYSGTSSAGEATDSSDSSSVKVWRVDSSQNHTIAKLLGIDRDTLMQFNKSHQQE